MRWQRWTLTGLLSILTLGIFMASCSGGDDDDNLADDDDGDDTAADDTGDDDIDDDTTADDTADDDVDDTTDDDTGGPPTDLISIHIADFVSGANIAGAECELVRNDDGSSYDPPIVVTSGTHGYCTFNETAVKGQIFSVKFSKAGYVTSYFFNYQTEVNWYFNVVSTVVRTAIFDLLVLTEDPSKGAVTGAVKWIDDTQDPWVLQEVGCAPVTFTGSGTVYYFQAGMPTTERSGTNPMDGYFLSLLVDPGAYELSTDLGGDTAQADVPMVFTDAITYTNLNYFIGDYPENPTPDDCI